MPHFGHAGLHPRHQVHHAAGYSRIVADIVGYDSFGYIAFGTGADRPAVRDGPEQVRSARRAGLHRHRPQAPAEAAKSSWCSGSKMTPARAESPPILATATDTHQKGICEA